MKGDSWNSGFQGVSREIPAEIPPKMIPKITPEGGPMGDDSRPQKLPHFQNRKPRHVVNPEIPLFCTNRRGVNPKTPILGVFGVGVKKRGI